jgi:hypothetical protein
MRKVLSMVAMIAAFALIVGLGVTAFAQGSDPSTNVPTVSSTEDRSSSSSDDPSGDVSGNCDEAEHADDPECQGVTSDLKDDGEDEADDDGVENADEDNSGPSENSGTGSVDDDPEDSDDVDDQDVDDVDEDLDDNSGSGSDDGTDSDD